MKHVLLAAALVAIAQTTADLKVRTTTEVVQAFRPAESASGLQLDALDKTADACTDFYQFACGGWIANNPMPADRSAWGRFDELQDRNNETLRHILDAAAAGGDAGIEEDRRLLRLVHGRERRSTPKARRALDPVLKKIAALSTVNDLAPLVAELHAIGVNVVLPVRLAGRLQGRRGRNGDRRPGRPRPARSRLLLQGRSEVGRDAEAVRRARRPDVRAARRVGG